MTSLESAYIRRVRELERQGNGDEVLAILAAYESEHKRLRAILSAHPAVRMAVADLNRLPSHVSDHELSVAMGNARAAWRLACEDFDCGLLTTHDNS